MKTKRVRQICCNCGQDFWLEYHEDGTYDYMNEPCECESEFMPAPWSPTISEWLKEIKAEAI